MAHIVSQSSSAVCRSHPPKHSECVFKKGAVLYHFFDFCMSAHKDFNRSTHSHKFDGLVSSVEPERED